jgi:hypothetical protein
MLPGSTVPSQRNNKNGRSIVEIKIESGRKKESVLTNNDDNINHAQICFVDVLPMPVSLWKELITVLFHLQMTLFYDDGGDDDVIFDGDADMHLVCFFLTLKQNE